MATVREGNQVVLVVVDVQVGVVAETWDADRIVSNVARTVERARTAGVPVVWVQHDDDELPHGSAQWQWRPELGPAEGEPIVPKHHNSSFEETALDDELARLHATHIALAGAATNWCVRSTAYGALERGYDLTLVADGHTTEPIEFEGGRRIEPADVIDELNTVMRWVSYPGRSTRTTTSDHIDFAALAAAPAGAGA
jgi:nicotinamidase-related amidase